MIPNLTLEEKAKLVCGGTFFGTCAIEEKGIPAIKLLDGGTGMNFEQMFGDSYLDICKEYTRQAMDNVTRYFFDTDKLTDSEKELHGRIYAELQKRTGFDTIAPGCYAPGIALGSTWDKETIREVGNALGLEAALYRISILLGTPNTNLLRDPRNGRFFEGYSEDPYLSGELAREMCIGVEEMGVASNTKHFAANNLEFNRVGINQKISMRALREMYFPAFKKCAPVTETFMASYPKINGKSCAENNWLTNEVLRDEWGFKGLVMTDWGACIGKTGDSVACGIDLVMPGPWDSSDVVAAVKEGRLKEEDLDKGVERVLYLVNKYLNVHDNVPADMDFDGYVAYGDKAAYKSACEGIVMLINKDNAFPVKEDANVVVFGKTFRNCGDGSAQVFTSRKSEFEFENISYDDFDAFEKTEGVVGIVVCSLPSAEGTDRKDLKIDSETDATLRKLISLRNANPTAKIALVLNTPGPVEIAEFKDDLDGLFVTYYPGMMGLKALSDIMKGKVNPSGCLTVTFPVRYEDTPAFLSYPDSYESIFGEDIYVGYRGYQKRKIAPLFPFGMGLSYSSFSISDMKIENKEVKAGDKVKVSFVLTNNSDMPGKKVVQLYSEDVVSSVNKAVRELRAFGKFYLDGNSSERFEVEFDSNDLSFYSEDFEKFVVEEGEYVLKLGFNCDDLPLDDSIYLTDGSPELRPGINWSIERVKAVPELYDALVLDLNSNDIEEMVLINELRYTPFNSVKKILGEDIKLEVFEKACAEYKMP